MTDKGGSLTLGIFFSALGPRKKSCFRVDNKFDGRVVFWSSPLVFAMLAVAMTTEVW